VDTKRLDAIVNLIGELVLSRNRLKTLRTRLRDEELDRAVSTWTSPPRACSRR
jgi:two-component system chemotaxis sensor kinase CheA